MKVRIKKLGIYDSSIFITKEGDIVEAKRSGKNGYECLCSYGKKTGWLFFNNEEVEVIQQTDSIVESVINQFKQRSEAGINKYGTTLDRNDLSTLEWLTHLSEELMDATLYIEKLKQELK